ncbi:MAG: ion transporter [Chryseolinea sp.]
MSKNAISRERKKLLVRINEVFEGPLIFLGFVWLVLLIIELVSEASPVLETLGFAIWGIFIIDFLIKLILAPVKGVFLKSNILTMISLAVPAFRVLRIFRVLKLIRFSRGLRLVKVIGSLNRGMRALSLTMRRRAFGYVFFLTLIIIFAGAAGMYAFEKDTSGGLTNYGAALWWTTMIMATLGSDFWPQTVEGRILCIVLALYAFAVFGYITATIATFFIGRDAEDKNGELAGAKQIERLTKEIQTLKDMVSNLSKDERN